MKNSTQQYTKTVNLTPNLAKQLLSNVYEGQRKLSNTDAEKMARDIKSGRWNNDMFWNEPLAINPDGALMNGQHRCKAVIIAQKPIKVDIRYNVPTDNFKDMDGGKSRTAQQFVTCSRPSIAVSIARFAIPMENGLTVSYALGGYVDSATRTGASRKEILEYIDNNEDEISYAATMADQLYYSFKGGSKSGIARAIWLISRSASEYGSAIEKIESFRDDIRRDSPKSPSVASAKQYAFTSLLNASKQNLRLREEFWFYLILAMWDAYGTRKLRINRKDTEVARDKYKSATLKDFRHL